MLLEAHLLSRLALVAAERTPGEEHPNALMDMNNSATLPEAQGKLVDTQPDFRQ